MPQQTTEQPPIELQLQTVQAFDAYMRDSNTKIEYLNTGCEPPRWMPCDSIKHSWDPKYNYRIAPKPEPSTPERLVDLEQQTIETFMAYRKDNKIQIECLDPAYPSIGWQKCYKRPGWSRQLHFRIKKPYRPAPIAEDQQPASSFKKPRYTPLTMHNVLVGAEVNCVIGQRGKEFLHRAIITSAHPGHVRVGDVAVTYETLMGQYCYKGGIPCATEEQD